MKKMRPAKKGKANPAKKGKSHSAKKGKASPAKKSKPTSAKKGKPTPAKKSTATSAKKSQPAPETPAAVKRSPNPGPSVRHPAPVRSSSRSAMAETSSTVVPGFGDLADPEVMLSYKIELAIAYRDALQTRQNSANCPPEEAPEIATELLKVIGNLNLLRAQLTSLQNSSVALVPPTPAEIVAVREASAAVETLVRTDAILAGALGLVGQVLAATSQCT